MADVRLIDANALLVNVAHRNVLDVLPGVDFERSWIYATVQNDMFKTVEKAPTIDAVPVVHARWIRQDDTFTRFSCSACSKKNYPGHERYCPNCGAKMDGGAENA